MKLNSDLSHGKATFKKSICSEYKLTIWVGVSTRLRKGLTTWRKKMEVKTLVLRSLFVLSFLFQPLALASGSYPDGPELTSTPGSLCEIGVKRFFVAQRRVVPVFDAQRQAQRASGADFVSQSAAARPRGVRRAFGR